MSESIISGLSHNSTPHSASFLPLRSLSLSFRYFAPQTPHSRLLFQSFTSQGWAAVCDEEKKGGEWRGRGLESMFDWVGGKGENGDEKEGERKYERVGGNLWMYFLFLIKHLL